MEGKRKFINGCRLGVLQDEESSLVDGIPHNRVEVLNVTEMYIKMIRAVNFMLCIFYCN